MRVMQETLELHPSVENSIREHSQQQYAKGGYEAVGFVACKYGKSLGVATVPLHNHAPDPTCSFFVEPWEQYRAERKLERQGYDILGIYHSHPTSEALPSGSDHAMAWPAAFVMIYSIVFDELRAYKENEGVLEPVGLIIQEGG